MQREEYLRTSVTSDYHSPDEYRVNGIVPNIDGWYTAFDVKGGAKLFRKPDQRVRIW